MYHASLCCWRISVSIREGIGALLYVSPVTFSSSFGALSRLVVTIRPTLLSLCHRLRRYWKMERKTNFSPALLMISSGNATQCKIARTKALVQNGNSERARDRMNLILWEKVGFVISLSDINLLLWGLLRSRKNRGISVMDYSDVSSQIR